MTSRYKKVLWGKYQFRWGYSLNQWALPLDFAIGQVDYGKRWGFGCRFLCFTFTAEKDFQGYAIGRSLI